jgi:hypothetical protein
MRKNLLVITSVLYLASTSAEVAAAPVLVDSAAGLLGSPVAQVPVQDPVIQKAIEWIQSKQTKPDQLQKKEPQSTIGKRFMSPRKLILGGPEIIPM